MIFDKLFKKKPINEDEKDITEVLHEKDKTEVAESAQKNESREVNLSSTLYERPDLGFLKEKEPIDDMLKELGLDAYDTELEDIDQDSYIESMLEEANDILGNNIDLDAIMSGTADDSMELDALKASLAATKASDISDSKKREQVVEPPKAEQPDDDNTAAQSEYDMLFGDSDFDNLDELIYSALERDKQEEVMSTFDESNRDFINDTSVFQDDNIYDVAVYQKPKPKYVEFVENASPKKLNLIVAALGVLIIIVVAATSYIALNNTRAKIIANYPGGAAISQANAPINNANFIYVNLGLKFNDDTLVLTKVLVDSLCTGFYFNKMIDTSILEITLVDDLGNIYAPDLSFTRLKEQTNELRFQPLESNVRAFYLYISDTQTGEDIVYKLSLSGNVILPDARYMGKSKDLMANNPDLQVFVEGMTFSSSGTFMKYSLHWNDDLMVLQLGRKNNSQTISVTEDGRNVSPLTGNNTEYLFADENMILGRMEYAPLRNLNSNITVKFTDLYRKYDLHTEIPAERLFRYKSEGELELELFDYKLVLERAGWQGERLILVCHSQALNLYAVSGISQDNDNRTETILDVKAKIKTSDGNEVILEGDCRSSALGTDIIFDAGEAYGKVRTAGTDNIVFDISYAYIKNEDLSLSYSLDEKRTRPDAETAYTEAALIAAFESRLAFKSGYGDAFSVIGFSEEISSPERLLRDYSPIPDAKAVYSAQIITMSISGDEAYAIVSEYWKGRDDGQTLTITNLHKIEAIVGNDGWVIISDEVIQE